jgi:pimeloyl-ACP methyl ester carboxylesterase
VEYFTQTDPMPLGGGAYESAYVYGRNNPSLFTDPSGLRAVAFGKVIKDCVSNGGANAPTNLKASVAGRGNCLYAATTQGAGGAIEISANAASATTVVVYLGATGSNIGNWDQIAGRAASVGGGSIATVAYQWFDAPQGISDAARSSPSGGSGTQLAEFISMLQTAGKKVTLIGHSWGGLVANEGVRRGAQPDGLVLMGSLASPNSFPGVRSMMNFHSADDATETIARGFAPSYRMRDGNKGGVLDYDSNDECRSLSYCVVGNVAASTGHNYMEDTAVRQQVQRYAQSR